MLGHTPQCSGVSTQVLAECTPALAGEGRKNQSLLVPNVLERAEERRSTLRELAKVARAEGRPRPPAVRTASRKGSNDQLQLGLGCAERRRVGRDRRAARARREHRSAAGAVPLTWLCRAGQCLNDHIAGAVSTAIAATARWRASAASAGERRQRTGAPRRVDASRPGAEQARTSGATRACRGGRLFQPPDIGVQGVLRCCCI